MLTQKARTHVFSFSGYVDAASIYRFNVILLQKVLFFNITNIFESDIISKNFILGGVIVKKSYCTKKHFIIYTSPVAFKKRGKEELTLSKNLINVKIFFKQIKQESLQHDFFLQQQFDVLIKKIFFFCRTLNIVVNDNTFSTTASITFI
jgi:hypothetical protein